MTNETLTWKQLITRYAQRMPIENGLADSIDFFHLNVLSSSVALKVDFDVTLTIVASGIYRLLGKRITWLTSVPRTGLSSDASWTRQATLKQRAMASPSVYPSGDTIRFSLKLESSTRSRRYPGGQGRNSGSNWCRRRRPRRSL